MFKKIYKYGEREAFCLYRDGITQKHELKDLFWECTLNCNLRCKHCGSFAGNKRLPDELTTEEIKTAFQKIARGCDPGKILINVTGGEPLMRPDLCDVMGYAANELGFHWGMTTNGMLLTENNIQKLKEAGLATVAVSIDGMPQTHDAFRGCEGSYKTVVENIARLRDAGFLRHLQVSTVFHKSNIDELEPLYNEINKLRINSWRLITVDPIGRAEQNADILLSGPEIKRILDFIKAKNKLNGVRLQYGCPGYLGLEYENEVRSNYFFCRTGINVASILYNGDLFVCPDVPRHPDLIQGNIKTDDFWDVWNNGYRVFRDPLRSSCEECLACDSWKYCLGGAYHTWDYINGKQKKCTYKMINDK